MQYAAAHANHVGFDGDGKVSVKSVDLDRKLQHVLKKRMKIKKLFDMQGKVFSHIKKLSDISRSGDVVLLAPTGSGKTLAYALPIAHELVSRTVSRLRAVIVVPTRDLANQVADVFEQLTRDVGIRVESAVGASSIASEACAVCEAEVLVATPGRLVYHTENTEGFVLKHVRYLVLDESDRLLEDSYQDWIKKVLPLIGNYNYLRASKDNEPSVQRPLIGMLALAMVPEVTARNSAAYSGVSQEHVRKILVSATQTTNPMRLHDLDLRNPTFFQPSAGVTDESAENNNEESRKGSVPPNMTERGWVVKDLQEKPAGLLVLLGWVKGISNERSRKNDQGTSSFQRGGAKLVFTHSVESAHRLCRLLEMCAFALKLRGDVFEMSGELSAERRHFVLGKIKELSEKSAEDGQQSNRFLIVVCSDVLARGMDMVNVETIINYDAPVHINKYLHRAGRTARAGRPGTVHTLLLEKQARHFRQMVREADRGDKKVVTKNLTVEFPEDSHAPRAISGGLISLRRILRRESLGVLRSGDSLPQYTLYELCSNSELANTSHEQQEEAVDDDELAKNNSRKRPRELAQEEFDSHQEHYDDGENADEEGEDVDDEENDDNFTDLLFSQIAQGLSAQSAAGSVK